MRLVNKLFILLIGVILIGCCTIVPEDVKSSGASYDPTGDRNSGFIGWTTNNNIAYGVITFYARERYNSLIHAYGSRFSPPLQMDSGLIDNKTNYWITLNSLSHFMTMNSWKKNELPK